MKIILTIAAFLFFLHVEEVAGQVLYSTGTGEVSFYSDTPLETIEAVNKKTGSIINATSRELAVQMKITDFVFPNKLMQEHFNENYLESEKYPTAVFKGKIKELVLKSINKNVVAVVAFEDVDLSKFVADLVAKAQTYYGEEWKFETRLRDGIYVLRMDDMLNVKRIAIEPKGRQISVISDNPSYPTWQSMERRSINIVGRVLWFGRKLQ